MPRGGHFGNVAQLSTTESRLVSSDQIKILVDNRPHFPVLAKMRCLDLELPRHPEISNEWPNDVREEHQAEPLLRKPPDRRSLRTSIHDTLRTAR
jgi:hypothetical protein